MHLQATVEILHDAIFMQQQRIIRDALYSSYMYESDLT